MKKLIALAVVLLITVQGFAQDGKSIYNKYSGEEGVSAVYISKAMFKMMGKLPSVEINDSDVNLSKVVSSLDAFYLIEEQTLIGGVPVVLSDTAGIRSTDDYVEKIGVERSLAVRDRAQLILCVLDGSSPLTAEDRGSWRMPHKRQSCICAENRNR